jgi:hypothetical protein
VGQLPRVRRPRRDALIDDFAAAGLFAVAYLKREGLGELSFVAGHKPFQLAMEAFSPGDNVIITLSPLNFDSCVKAAEARVTPAIVRTSRRVLARN